MKPSDREQLEVALSAQRPLEVERLVPTHKRRVTITDHERWQLTGKPPHQDDADLAGLILEIREIKREGFNQ